MKRPWRKTLSSIDTYGDTYFYYEYGNTYLFDNYVRERKLYLIKHHLCCL